MKQHLHFIEMAALVIGYIFGSWVLDNQTNLNIPASWQTLVGFALTALVYGFIAPRVPWLAKLKPPVVAAVLMPVVALLVMSSSARAMPTVPGVIQCADVHEWTIVQIWNPPPPNAYQFPSGMPGPLTETTFCVATADGQITLNSPY